jgi:hypothetical protein|tara:strand:- start:25 stop:303 length:279 start_codon:yes stop_codon:yes gene_type:complete
MKQFYIKLVSITLAAIVVLNVIYNLFFSENINKINQILSFSDKSKRIELRNKIRSEIKESLKKDNIFAEEDKKILFQLFKKIENEFKTVSDK